jgi:hypothetical protein
MRKYRFYTHRTDANYMEHRRTTCLNWDLITLFVSASVDITLTNSTKKVIKTP